MLLLIKIASLGECGRDGDRPCRKEEALMSFKELVFRVAGFRSKDSARSTERCCSATKASVPKELVGDIAVEWSLVTSSSVTSKP